MWHSMSSGSTCHFLVSRSAMSRREQNKREVREAIVSAALELFEAEGFENVTVDAIVERAAVSPRTFFRYFPAKEEVAFPRWRERLARFEERLAEADGDEPLGSVREAIRVLADEVEEAPERELRLQRIVDASPALRARDTENFGAWEAAIAERLRRGRSKKEARRAAVVAAALVAATRTTFRAWVESDGRARFERLEREADEALRAAFA